jgi:hypothetical protein
LGKGGSLGKAAGDECVFMLGEAPGWQMISLPILTPGWDAMCYRLQANFDGLVNNFCSNPPPLAADDGKAIFDCGKRMTNVRCVDGRPLVEVEDVGSGKGSNLDAGRSCHFSRWI